MGALKGTFANLGSIVKSSDKKKELRLELGGGFIQTRPISNQTAKEAILSNAKNGAEQLENILNGNTHMIEKVQTKFDFIDEKTSKKYIKEAIKSLESKKNKYFKNKL